MAKVDVKKLIRMGYRRTSNRFGLVSRIDRPDWKEHMASSHPSGMAWVECLARDPGSCEDHYRRVYSKDKLELGQSIGKQFPPSRNSVTGYVAERD